MKTIVLLSIIGLWSLAFGDLSVRGAVPSGRIQLNLEMVDGSRLIGTVAGDKHPRRMDTRFGKLSLPLSQWEQFEVTENGEKVVVTWSDGDRISGWPDRDSFAVETLVGRADVTLAMVRRGKVTILEASEPLKPADVNVSGSYGHAGAGWGNHQVAYATDGDLGSSWSSGDWKGWIELDLGEIHELSSIKATLQFAPSGSATHCIYVSNHPISTHRDGARFLKRFSGNREDKDILAVTCAPGTKARYVQVHCPSSRSWFNLRELEVFGVAEGSR